MKGSGGAGPSWVFIHGWATNSDIWAPVIHQLQAACVCLPLPGYPAGETDVDRLPEGESVLVGWSLGGLRAIDLAVSAGARVKAVVLVAASPCFVQRADWSEAMPATQLQEFARRLQRDRVDCLKRFMALQSLGDANAAAVRAGLKAVITDAMPGSDVLAQGLAQLASRDLRRELATLDCPVQVILGERDRLIPVTQAQGLEALGQGIHITIMPGAAHLPFLSNTRGFLDMLTQGPAANG